MDWLKGESGAGSLQSGDRSGSPWVASVQDFDSSGPSPDAAVPGAPRQQAQKSLNYLFLDSLNRGWVCRETL